MRYFHYCTWSGEVIIGSGKIIPSRAWAGHDLKCPPLVFLTTDEYWEPSIQSVACGEEIKDHKKEPSDPAKYTKKGIPCYKFTVEIEPECKLIYNVPQFIPSLVDAQQLGSDLSKWHWAEKELIAIKTEKFINNTWY